MKLSLIFLVVLYSMQSAHGQFIPKSYIAFVIDDTSSMGEEITGVKQWVTKCANGDEDYSDCAVPPTGGWILSTFNDPDVGPIVGPTTNLEEITSGIDNVTAHGGGDCPELAMQGVLNALSEVPAFNLGCKVFFFSDATAKDEEFFEQVKTDITRKDCTFIPILTGCCGECQDPCLTLPDSYCDTNVDDLRPPTPTTTETPIPRDELKRSRRAADSDEEEAKESLLYDLAYSTGGKIILAPKMRADEFLELLETEVKIVSCPSDVIAGPLPNGFTKEQCNSKKACWNGVKKQCFCQSDTKCPTGKPVCTGTPVFSYHPDPENCSKYYICAFKSIYESKCRAGTVFDSEVLRCDSPSNVASPCGTRRI